MITQLSDDFPVLLGPVRIETRFTATELLIRVFPDEWSVDKFETRPTQAEIAALDAYWTARWIAAGSPAGQQAAWQELVQRIGSGRGAWLLRTRVPANPADEPSGLAPGITVLVVVSATALAVGDRTPTTTYWTAVWRAHGDRQRLRQAEVALRTAVGATRAAAIKARRPAGIDTAAVAVPTDPLDDPVAVVYLVLPTPDPADLASQSWTQAAQAQLLPDRFQVLGYVGERQVLSVTGSAVPAALAVSPDPGAVDQLSVDPQTGALHVPDNLRWLTDFDRAVAVGMGLRIPLTDQLRPGLDRLIVFGLRQQSTPEKTAADLAALITRQLRSPNGYSLLPQGTPTNNTEQAPAGQDAAEEAEAALRSADAPALAAIRAPATAIAAAAGWTARTDGQQFAELLGLDPAVLDGMPNADGTDQRDARAANTALWPATWGYFLQTALHPILGPAAIAQTRKFFLQYVSGRGPLPVVRIGRQPYGIIPTTAFSRLAWPTGSASATHRRGLNTVLSAAAQDWQSAAEARVAHLGENRGDVHQRLLDILALHPTSAEYYQRYAQSVEDVFNRENLGGLGSTVPPALERLNLPGPVRALLTRFGYPDTGPGQDPDLLRRLFVDAQQPLLAPLIDDRPLSETDQIRAYTPDQRNYLHWLAGAARTDLDTVRLELGFLDDAPPAALLYLLARHAVLLGWADAARNLAVAAGLAGPDELITDPAFIHIRIPRSGQSLPSESRFRRLYSPAPTITGNPSRLLVDYLPDVLESSPSTADLAEQVEALDLLSELSTARLERVLTEHLDLATYRLDSWRLGLATERLGELRYGPDGSATPRRGVHLGAYGWLENVAPRSEPFTPVQLSGPLATLFGAGLQQDPDNQGFVHTPSPAHARTAAVLRAGYAANRSPDNDSAFAVNLSSERVRVALGLLDGLRQGQSLGALLGYRFERGLHDRAEPTDQGDHQVELDSFIEALRLQFPLRAGKIAETATDPGKPVVIAQIEARNVVDGLALVRHVTRGGGSPLYPFGLEGVLPPADPDQITAISDEVARLLDTNDALADLAVAEGTHQALLGNVERASATLDAYAKEGFPPDPAVVRSPRSGVTLTHRLAVRFSPGLSPHHGSPDTPRGQAEPAVNDWLSRLLPDDSDVAVLVTWTDPVNGHAQSEPVTQDDLKLGPIDLLWAVRTPGEGSMTELDDRILGVVIDKKDPRPDAELTIQHTGTIPGKTSFFALSPLIGALRTLLTTSRPLRPSDQVPAAQLAGVDQTIDDDVSVPRERPAAVRRALDDLGDDVARFLRDLGALYPAAPRLPDRPHILNRIDDFLTRYAELVGVADGFGLVRSGWGELIGWRRQIFGDVLAAVAAVVDRMTRALADADAILARYDRLPSATSDAERFRILLSADRLLITKPTPLPDRPSKLRNTVIGHRRDFADRLKPLKDQAGTGQSTISGLLAVVSGRLPLTDVDPTGLDLTPYQDRVLAFGRELLARGRALQADVLGRITAADAALTDYDHALPGADQAQAGTDALKALLGPDVLVVPEFTPPEAVAAQWRKARNDSGKLLQHLIQGPFNRDFPLDDWLHGLARVREMPRLWEKTLLLSNAVRGRDPGSEPQLTPIQLPYHQNDHWLGLEFTAGTTITEDKLLFTAHYPDGTNDDDEHCGLLLDEWTEVIGTDQETTGVAVHVNGPDSEPPQAMLLVAPPVGTGNWNTDDLVAAVTETFDLARSRAVEPAHLDETGYAQLLPATVLSATRQPITISTDLSIANARWKADHD